MRRQKRKIPVNGGYVMPSTLASSPESGKFTLVMWLEPVYCSFILFVYQLKIRTFHEVELDLKSTS